MKVLLYVASAHINRRREKIKRKKPSSTNQEIRRRSEELKNLDRYAFGQVMWNKKKSMKLLRKMDECICIYDFIIQRYWYTFSEEVTL